MFFCLVLDSEGLSMDLLYVLLYQVCNNSLYTLRPPLFYFGVG